jgi:hypothetical protein
MWTRFLLAFTIATNMLAQQDPTNLLLRVETRIAESLDRLPRHMCTETIDRSRFESGVHSRSTACEEDPTRANNNLTMSDRLRLDVTKATAVEMYSWVGESRFDDRDLLDMVHEGALSTGSFGTYLGQFFVPTTQASRITDRRVSRAARFPNSVFASLRRRATIFSMARGNMA